MMNDPYYDGDLPGRSNPMEQGPHHKQAFHVLQQTVFELVDPLFVYQYTRSESHDNYKLLVTRVFRELHFRLHDLPETEALANAHSCVNTATRLADQLFHHNRALRNKLPEKAVQMDQLSRQLRWLIDQVYLYWPDCTRAAHKIPEVLLHQEKMALQQRRLHIEKKLPRAILCPRLLAIALEPLQLLTIRTYIKVNWQQLWYLQALMTNLETLLAKPTTSDLQDEALLHLLWTMRHNDPAFASYYTASIQEQVKTKQKLNEQCWVLEKQKLALEQCQPPGDWLVHQEGVYLPGQPALPVQLALYLRLELNILEKKAEYTLSASREETEEEAKESLLCDGTVDILAGMLKTFKSIGFVLNRNMFAAMRAWAALVGTLNSPHPTFNHIKTAYNKIEVPTMRKLIKIFEDAAKWLRDQLPENQKKVGKKT
jgi:hypothetical protein